MRFQIRFVQMLAAGLALHGSVAMAASPVIGTVVSKGGFRLDSFSVKGNATLTEGSTVETGAASSLMQLSSGVLVTLASDSKGKLFGDRMLLEKGGGQLERAAGFRVEALGLRIQPETGQSSARVALAAKRVRVAALAGSFRVLNGSGVLIANVAAGSALEFEPQPAGGPTRMAGCLSNRSGRFLLTDETTNVSVEATGAGLSKEAGNRVEITGAMDSAATPADGASQLIRVTQVKRLSQGCGAGKGAAAAAAGAGGAAAGAGAGAGAAAGIAAGTVAIVGGVAAAAVVGGLAAAGGLSGQGSADPPVSR